MITMPEDEQDDLDRILTLYEQGDLKTEEYDLLKSQLSEDLPSTDISRRDSGGSLDSDSTQEAVPFDIVAEFRDIVPKDKYENSFEMFHVEDKSTDDIGMILVSYLIDEDGFHYSCTFHERAHEERMFEMLSHNQWELVSDSSDDSVSPSVMIRRKAGRGGFQDELPSGYVDEEVSQFLDLVQTVYQTDLSDLVKSS